MFRTLSIPLLLLVACDPGRHADDRDADAARAAADAAFAVSVATDASSGAEQQPADDASDALPEPEDLDSAVLDVLDFVDVLDVTLTVEGEGPSLPPTLWECGADGSAELVAVWSGEGHVDPDEGIVVVALADAASSVTTSAGCPLPALGDVTATRMTLHASAAATAPVCDAWCASTALFDAELACEGSEDSASCVESTAMSLEASCDLACSSQAVALTASAAAQTDTALTLDGPPAFAGTLSGWAMVDADGSVVW